MLDGSDLHGPDLHGDVISGGHSRHASGGQLGLGFQQAVLSVLLSESLDEGATVSVGLSEGTADGACVCLMVL